MDTCYHVTNLASALAGAMCIQPPEHAEAPAQILSDYFSRALFGQKAERMLLYAADSVPSWIVHRYARWFEPVFRHTDLAVPLRTVMPSVTPVCFASIFSGAMPEVHGIREYNKPILTIDTLFDCAIRAGKRVAIVATEGCSMAMIFMARRMDYFICETDAEVTARAKELLAADRYDLICVYHADYDTIDHRLGPEHEDTLNALKYCIQSFDELCQIADEAWRGKSRVVGFLTDHGCHPKEAGGGGHGTDMDEDLNILHFYRATKN